MDSGENWDQIGPGSISQHEMDVEGNEIVYLINGSTQVHIHIF